MIRIFFLILFCLPAFLFAQIVKPSVVIDSSGYIIAKTPPTKYEANEYWLNGSPFLPAKTAIVSDSLSLKYLYADSTNISSNINNYLLPNNSLSYNNVALGAYAFNLYTGALINNIGIGYYTCFGNGSPGGRWQQNIMIGNYSGAYDPYYGALNNEYYNIGIGYAALRDLGGSNPNQYNIGIGYYAGSWSGNMLNNIFIGTYTGSYGGLTNSLCVGNYAGGYGNAGDSDILIGNYSGYLNTGSGNILIGDSVCYNAGNQNVNNSIVIGYNPFVTFPLGNSLIISNRNYYPSSDYIRGDLSTANLYLKANFNIDSSGMVLKYHSLAGLPNRTAGIDSLLNGTDTVFTTAYDTNSLVFITDLSPAGTPGHQYVNKAISVSGSYFVVKSMSALDDSQFNWFILKTY